MNASTSVKFGISLKSDLKEKVRDALVPYITQSLCALGSVNMLFSKIVQSTVYNLIHTRAQSS